jgi:hypothetical protein
LRFARLLLKIRALQQCYVMRSHFEKRDDCKPCKRKQLQVDRKKNGALLTGILLALLPKCPFCFVAYSSTMMLCGKGGTLISERSFASLPAILFTTLLCLTALFCIIFNYRDRRTRYAIALAALGSILIILSVSVKGGLPVYYGGVLLVFGGVWLNASLLYFINKIKHALNRLPRAISKQFVRAK